MSELFTCIKIEGAHGIGKDFLCDLFRKVLDEKEIKHIYMEEMWSPQSGYMTQRDLHGQKESVDQEIWWYFNWAIRECWTQTLFENFQTRMYLRSDDFETPPIYSRTEFEYLFNEKRTSIFEVKPPSVILHNRSFISVLAYSRVLLSSELFNTWIERRLLEIYDQCNFPRMEVILTCTPEVALKRLKKRKRATAEEWNEFDMDYWNAVNTEIVKIGKAFGAEIYDVSDDDAALEVIHDILEKSGVLTDWDIDREEEHHFLKHYRALT
jgi:thymidylate kinase